MCNEFVEYWTQPNKSFTKMGFELKETWEVGQRLATWKKKDEKFEPKNTNGSTAKITPSLTGYTNKFK